MGSEWKRFICIVSYLLSNLLDTGMATDDGSLPDLPIDNVNGASYSFGFSSRYICFLHFTSIGFHELFRHYTDRYCTSRRLFSGSPSDNCRKVVLYAGLAIQTALWLLFPFVTVSVVR